MRAQLNLPTLETSALERRAHRTIHYLGSKLRFLDFIKEIADELDPKNGHIIDLFAGSGAVSRHFSKSRRVISADIQEYSRVICSALMQPRFISTMDEIETFVKQRRSAYISLLLPLIELEDRILHGQAPSEDLAAHFLESCSIYTQLTSPRKNIPPSIQAPLSEVAKFISSREKEDLLITRYFGGVFFSFEQSIELDALLDYAHLAPVHERDTLLSCVLGTASDIANTVGKQFAQPLQPRSRSGEPKPGLVARMKRDRTISVLDTFGKRLARSKENDSSDLGHLQLRADFRRVLESYACEASIIYADPPYTRDHYSRFYHALETIALADFPEVTKSKRNGEIRISRGLYRANRYQSEFCIKSTAPAAFRDLFQLAARNNSALLLSYSPFSKADGAHPRVVELEDLIYWAEQSFNSVEIKSPGLFSHSRLNKRDLHLKSGDSSEVLVVCK